MAKEDEYFIRKKPGDELAALDLTITPEENQQFLYAMEDFHPSYLEASTDGPPLVHPALLLLMSLPSKSPSFHLPPGWAIIHAGDETEFLQAARVGAALQIHWHVTGTWQKRGRLSYETAARIVDEQNNDILRRKVLITYTHRQDEGSQQ